MPTYMAGTGLGVTIGDKAPSIVGLAVADRGMVTIGVMVVMDTDWPGPPESGRVRVSGGSVVVFDVPCDLRVREVICGDVEGLVKEIWIYQDGVDNAKVLAVRGQLLEDERARRREDHERWMAAEVRGSVERGSRELGSDLLALGSGLMVLGSVAIATFLIDMVLRATGVLP